MVVAELRPVTIYTLLLQAQVVLQGKSRSIIIRELQRTNLDVNLAVNNLLSRDDEDGDDGDDTASESYLPGGLYPAAFDKKMPMCSYFSAFEALTVCSVLCRVCSEGSSCL